MAVTGLANAIIPEVFLPYFTKASVELSALWQSGIVSNDAQFSELVTKGGTDIDMPFWNDLTGDSEVIVEGVPSVPGNITSSKDKAKKLQRKKSWGAHDLVKFLAGSDPMTAIGDFMAGWWARDLQKITLSVLKGIFGTAELAANVSAIHHTSGGPGGATNANRFTGSTFIDAKGKLGDHANALKAIIVHSATEQSMRKQDLIDDVMASDGVTQISTYQKLRVIVDDNMPREEIDGELVYTTYLFAEGALAYGQDTSNHVPDGASPKSTYQLEFYRKADEEVSAVLTRKHFILHPRGVAWTNASMVNKSPTNAELQNASNWDPVFDPKEIRIVKFTHNLL